jgi:hypothetical protein
MQTWDNRWPVAFRDIKRAPGYRTDSRLSAIYDVDAATKKTLVCD